MAERFKVWGAVFGACLFGCGGSTDIDITGPDGGGTGASGGSTGGGGAGGGVGGGDTGGTNAGGGGFGGGGFGGGGFGGGGFGGGGFGGGGFGGTVFGGGGSGGCISVGCGPTGAPCCEPGLGCGTTGPGGTISCTCTKGLYWDCSTGTGGSGGTTGTCNAPSDCALGTTCCAGKCVNTANDPFNCGACGKFCPGPYPYCSGTCSAPPCFGGPPPPGFFCCGSGYCKEGQLCCDVQGPGPSVGPTCFTPAPSAPTCPIGCPLCQ